jgi:hypothetical protein
MGCIERCRAALALEWIAHRSRAAVVALLLATARLSS